MIVFLLHNNIFQKRVESNEQRVSFRTKMQICYQSSNINNVLKQCKNKILESFDAFESKGKLFQQGSVSFLIL